MRGGVFKGRLELEGEEVSVFGGWGGWRDVEEMGKAASGNMRKGGPEV